MNRIRRAFAVGFLLFLSQGALEARTAPLVLDTGEFQGQLIGRHLEFLEDPDGSLNIAGVRTAAREGRFQKVAAKIFQPGIWSNSVWWLRLPIANETETRVEWYLELESHLIDSATLYDSSLGAGEYDFGDRLPFARRPVTFRTFALPLSTAPGRTALYLRLETRGNKKFPLRVYSPKEFQEFRQRDLLGNGLFLGALSILFVYNLFLLVTVRDIGYLHVSAFILVAGLNFLWALGIGFQFLWPGSPAVNDHMIVVLPLGFVPLVPYLRRILETRMRVPLLDRLLLGFFYFAICFACLYPFISYSAFARIGLTVLIPASLVFLLVISLVGIIGLGMAYPAGKYFMIGVALFGLSLNLLFLILSRGFADSFAAQTIARLAFSLFIAFLSISILFKIRFVRDNLQALNAGREDEEEGPPASANETDREKSEAGNWTITPRMERKLQMALSFLRENYREEISREGLAAELDLNPDNLGRLFKMYTGDKIGDYVNKQRVQAAAWRLRDPERKIAEIALEVGFENLSTFNRVFKNIMKTTPSRFRDMAAAPETLRNF